jgi:hypothetical protein
LPDFAFDLMSVSGDAVRRPDSFPAAMQRQNGP